MLLVAASRVWLGVHWTTDVVASVILAIIGVAIIERLLGDRHQVVRRSHRSWRNRESPPADVAKPRPDTATYQRRPSHARARPT